MELHDRGESRNKVNIIIKGLCVMGNIFYLWWWIIQTATCDKNALN